MDVFGIIESYIPANQQEQSDKKEMLSFLKDYPNCFSRENTRGHFTASSWILNEERTKTLFCYHKIYNSWSWTGGHADGETDLLKVAIKEAVEETSVTVKGYKESIFSLEILPVAGHFKNGKYVSPHLHYNLTFLIIGDEDKEIRSNAEENTGVKWIHLADVIKESNEPHMHPIYEKLISKSEVGDT